MKRTFKSLIIFSIILLILIGAGFISKSIFLRQVKSQIQTRFGYTRLHFNVFPPSLVIEDVRSLSSSPFYSAEKITVSISFRSLLSREKSFRVFIENPTFRFYDQSSASDNQDQLSFQFSLPFALEMGSISDGELYYWGKDDRFQAKKINALLVQKRDLYSLLIKSSEALYDSSLLQKPLEGTLSLSLEGQGENVDIKKLRINSPSFIFRAEGRLSNPLNPEFNLTSSFNIKSALIAQLLKLPFEWDGEAVGKGHVARRDGEVYFDANFSGRALHLNDVNMGRVDGVVDFDSTNGGLVDIDIRRRGLSQEQLEIRFKNKRVQGEASAVHVDPVMKFLRLPWPVPSATWGNFVVQNKTLTVDVEFRDDFQDVMPGEYPLQGDVHVFWDGQKNVNIASQKLSTQFAVLEAQGEVHIGQNMDIVLKGQMSDVKQARELTSKLLNKNFVFPEIRGSGETNITISGDIMSPDVRGDFHLSSAGFAQFDVQTVSGDAEFSGNTFHGNIAFDDPLARGHVQISVQKKQFDGNLFIESGAVERILPVLNITLPLQGRAAGEFKLLGREKDIEVQGNFSSPGISFAGHPFTQLKGRLFWKDKILSFSNFETRLHGGSIRGSTLFDLAKKEFEVDLKTENIQLASIWAPISGILTFDLKGSGVFGQDYSSGQFDIKPLLIKPLQETEAEGDVRVGFTEKSISISLDGKFLPGDNDFYIALDIPLKSEMVRGDIRGSFDSFDLLIPDSGAKGQINYAGEIRSFQRSLEVVGAIDVQGSVFPIPKFAHALRDYSGLIFVKNDTLNLRSLRGTMGGGDVQAQGVVRLGKNGMEAVDLKVDGKNLLLSPLERTRVLTHGSLNLIKDPDRFVLDGDFDIQRLSWEREFNEPFVFYSTSTLQEKRENSFFDDLNLNIRLHADDDAWMENSLGRIRSRFDLTVSGNVKLPIVLGEIDALEGHVFFQDRDFEVIRGRVSFSNPVTVEPYLSFTGETYVKDFRVTFSLDGLLDKLTPEFSSSPPLPPEDVLALLALGESFRRTYHYDRTTQQSTASLVSFQLSEEAKKSADKLFRLDRFRIDPFVLGSSTEMTARLTLGKRISRNFFILYSTNLTTQREDIVRIEWELTNDLSIVGTRDEKGRISFDIKIHKRF